MALNSPEAQELIRLLVENDVALTSTQLGFENLVPLTLSGVGRAATRMYGPKLEAMAPHARDRYLTLVAQTPPELTAPKAALIRKALEFEHAFVDAGGHLMVGSDTTGAGGIVAGFDNHRAIELLVDGGFTPVEAIQVATLNGAEFLGEADSIGSVEVGKQADLMVVKGNLAENIVNIRFVEIAFKNGVGWDSQKLIESVKGMVGIR